MTLLNRVGNGGAGNYQNMKWMKMEMLNACATVVGLENIAFGKKR